MPKIKPTAKEAWERKIIGQIGSVASERYGARKLTGKVFGMLFGLKERTATERIKDPEDLTVRQLRKYARDNHLTDAQKLEWLA